MNTVNSLLSSTVTESLGWALLHSTWQSLVIILTIMFFGNLFKVTSSNVKYWMYVIGLFAMFGWFGYTFLAAITFWNAPYKEVAAIIEYGNFVPLQKTPGLQSGASSFAYYFPAIIGCWLVGIFFLALRTLGGLYYTRQLKRKWISPLQPEWIALLDKLRTSMGVKKSIQIYESVKARVPMVIGHIKPVILLPAGMLTGLSPAQIEAILLHELSHIKRHDYLINILQSVVEILFFYNPATWWLSNMIRKEREHSCDDVALTRGVNKIEFAKALAKMQELNITQNNIAMTFANNKNQLMERVKRIFGHEKKARTFEKSVPVILIVGALLCLSWYSIQPQQEKYIPPATLQHAIPDLVMKMHTNFIFPDTTIERGKVEQSTSRTHNTWTDEEGSVHEHTNEYVEENPEDFPEDFQELFDELREMPDVSALDVDIDNAFDVFKDMPDIDIDMDHILDTIPDMDDQDFHFHFDEKFESFNDLQKEMLMEMKKKMEAFKDFDGPDMERMEELMEKMAHEMRNMFEENEKMSERYHHDEKRMREREMRSREMKERAVQKQRMQEEREQNREKREQFSLKQEELHLKEMQEEMARKEAEMVKREAEMRLREVETVKRKNAINQYKYELQEELRKDGYLKKDEVLENFLTRPGEKMTVNGKPIKKKHLDKYEKLRKKYLD